MFNIFDLKAVQDKILNSIPKSIKNENNVIKIIKDNYLNILKTSYIYESNSKIESKVINHNLSSTNLLMELWIKEDDNYYYNDLSPVIIQDKNNIKVNFVKPTQFKIIIKKCGYDNILDLIAKNEISPEKFENIRQNLLKDDS